MTIFEKINRFEKNYQRYISDNPNGYWFLPKPYGWGWVAATWAGFFVSVGCGIGFFFSLFGLASQYPFDTLGRVLFAFVFLFILFTAFLVKGAPRGNKIELRFGVDTSDELVATTNYAKTVINVKFWCAVFVGAFALGLFFSL